MTATDDVLVPPGRPIAEAASWVGHACWTELRFHELLTEWLAEESHDEAVLRLWSLRAGAAGRAAAWHDRLPELRELPRPPFVTPSSNQVSAFFDALRRSTRDGDVDRSVAAELITAALRAGYEAHRSVATGPADGPVRRSLDEALASLHADGVGTVEATVEVPRLP